MQVDTTVPTPERIRGNGATRRATDGRPGLCVRKLRRINIPFMVLTCFIMFSRLRNEKVMMLVRERGMKYYI